MGYDLLVVYVSLELLKNKKKVIVTTISIKKKIKNYHYLKIQKKVKFIKLDVSKKTKIKKIINEFNPDKIFYFAGQSSLTKSLKDKKGTLLSHFEGTKNFLDIIKQENLKIKFFKANSGYIFSPKKGLIAITCQFSTNSHTYINSQPLTFPLIKNNIKFGLHWFHLVLSNIM